jgi:hypothetical protein
MQWTCPSGYIYYMLSQHCYKVTAVSVTWAAAQQACRADGAELASVASAQENAFILTLGPRSESSILLYDDNDVRWWFGQYGR